MAQKGGYPLTHRLGSLGVAFLALEDGRFFWGKTVGVPGETFGALILYTLIWKHFL